MKDDSNFKSTFRVMAFILLILTVLTIPIYTFVKKASYDHYNYLLTKPAEELTEEESKYVPIDMSNSIYDYNCVLCFCSIGLQIIYYIVLAAEYFSSKGRNSKKKGELFKELLKKCWPILLLVIFMIWVSVGCIQAAMEMDAEIMIKEKGAENVPQRIIEIANWSSGDRMSNLSDKYQNAKSRAWNGCNNLKDGYCSFLFYATVFLNILMLGNNAENFKRWVFRTFMVTSLLMVLLNYLEFLESSSLYNVIFLNRLTFNNSNHYGYYISVVLLMSLCLAITEKNYIFKALSLFNTFLYIPMVILNGTFGSYLGVLFGMIFLLLVTVIRLFSRKKIAEFVIYAVCLIWFILCSSSIVSWNSNGYNAKSKTVFWSISTLTFNVGDKTYVYSRNTISPDEAKELGVDNVSLNGNKVVWGNKLYALENRLNCFVVNNFRGLINDSKILFKFFGTKDDDKTSSESEESSSSSNSKESEEKVENKSGLSQEVSKTGSGRGEVWIRSLDLMNQRPMFGWGLENLLNEFYNQYSINEGRTHNLILQMGACCGIPAILIYLVAVISLFFKAIFDVKLRRYDKKGLLMVTAIFVLATILLNVIISSKTDKLLINGLFTVALWALLYAILFFKIVKLRIMDWNEFELIGSGVFVSYMISNLFGNTAFYTSPYFMIFLGTLTYEVITKKSRIPEEMVTNK